MRVKITGLEKIASFVFVMIVCKVLRRKLKQELLILMVKEEVIVKNSAIGVVIMTLLTFVIDN